MVKYLGDVIEEDLITILKLYFPNKRRGDLHNYPKSICDGIEKRLDVVYSFIFSYILSPPICKAFTRTTGKIKLLSLT